MSIARTRCGARLAVDYSGAGGSLPGERLRWFVRIGPMPQPHAAPQSPSSSRTPWRLQRQAPAAPPLATRGATPPEQRDHRAAASTLARSSAPRPRAPRTSLPLLEHHDPQRVSRLIKPAALRPAAPVPQLPAISRARSGYATHNPPLGVLTALSGAVAGQRSTAPSSARATISAAISVRVRLSARDFSRRSCRAASPVHRIATMSTPLACPTRSRDCSESSK
jgi:hypothetical protein